MSRSYLPAPAATAARAILASVIRHGITTAGAAMVAHGYLDQTTADAAVSPIADQVLGVILVLGASGWGVVRARLAHSPWAAAWAVLQGGSSPEQHADQKDEQQGQ